MFFFFFQAEDGIRDGHVTGVQTCALPICDEVRDRIHIVTAPSGKRNLPKVQIVGNPEVLERRQAVLIDGIPEAELSGYPSIEPLQYRKAVAALMCCRKTK